MKPINLIKNIGLSLAVVLGTEQLNAKQIKPLQLQLPASFKQDTTKTQIPFLPKTTKQDTTKIQIPILPKTKAITDTLQNYIIVKDSLINYIDNLNTGIYNGKIILTPTSDIDFNKYFSTQVGKISFEFTDGKQKLEKILEVLNQTKLNEKDRTFKRNIEEMLGYASQNSIDAKSLDRLNKAIEDGILNTQERFMLQIMLKNGIYLLSVKSPQVKKTNKEGITTLLQSNSTGVLYTIELKEKPPIITPIIPIALPKIIAKQDPAKKPLRKPSEKEEPRKVIPKTKKETEKPLEFIAGGGFGNVREIELGLKYGKIAGIINYGVGSDENVSNITTPVSPTGRYGTGTIDNVDYSALGISVEGYLGPLFAGIGFDKWEYTQKIQESIMKNGNALKTNSNSTSKNQKALRIYLGASKKITKNIDGQLLVGHDGEKGVYGGARLVYKFRR